MPTTLMRIFLFITLWTGSLWAIEPIVPLPQNIEYDREKALLGKRLFFDPVLSADFTVSCLNCHNFSFGGADPEKVSRGVNGAKGNVQSPTVLNARYNFKQFWNGRADDLTEQAAGPIHNPVEMAANAVTVEQRLNDDASYRTQFARAFGSEEITFDMVIEAIVEFENSLVTPDCKFDRYLRGETTLSPLESKGYQIFKEVGCITCHNGINVGGNSFQKMGLINPYGYQSSFPDRYAITKKEYHKNVFKVPTLRNIELTAPYFHDASAATLKEAISTMSHHNLGTKLTSEQVDALVEFLKTLTGVMPPILEME